MRGSGQSGGHLGSHEPGDGSALKEFSSTKSAEPEQVDSVPSSPGEGQLDHIGDVR